MSSIHGAVTATVTTPLDYRGKRHARMTTSMRRLPKTMRLVLLELRWRIPDGETKHVSNATLAGATGLSEASVSVYVRLLAGEPVIVKGETLQPPPQRFIARARRSDGPGYAITMLPPPELRQPPAPAPRVVEMAFGTADPAAAPAAPATPEGSSSDPAPHDEVWGVRTPQTPPKMGSLDDPSNHHESMTQQQHGAPVETNRADQARYPNCFAPLAARLAERFPHYPESAIRAGIAKLQTRRDVRAGRTSLEATLYYCLRENQPIYSQAELDARSLALQEPRHAPRPAPTGPAGCLGSTAGGPAGPRRPGAGAGRADPTPPERAPIRKFTRSW